MSQALAIRFVMAAALVALAWVRPVPQGLTPWLVAFGLVNIFFAVPGTRWIRAAALAMTVGAFAIGGTPAFTLLLAWLVWPPAFLVGWALARDHSLADVEDDGSKETAYRARVNTAGLILSVAVASLAFRGLLGIGLEQSAALFIGLPALIAIVVVFSVSPRSATGVACKAVTVGLLVSMLFLGEGVLCVLMSAPLFYGVAVVIGLVIDASNRQRHGAHKIYSSLVVLAFVPMSLEGVSDAWSFAREETVVETRLVSASPEMVAAAVRQPPRFDRTLPPYLRAAFPRPIDTWFERDQNGERLVVRMRGGETRLNGTEPKTGDLVLRIDDSQPGTMRWRALSDGSHMTHFLDWQESVVHWEPAGAHQTRVTWTVRYRRGLDPAWYFGPWERYAAHLAAGYLIESVATP